MTEPKKRRGRPPGIKSKKRRHAIHISPDHIVMTYLSDLDWQPGQGGSVYANVHSQQAGEVYIEAGPIAAGRFYAAAYGFMGATFWEQRDFETLKEAQLKVSGWWKYVSQHKAPEEPNPNF